MRASSSRSPSPGPLIPPSISIPHPFFNYSTGRWDTAHPGLSHRTEKEGKSPLTDSISISYSLSTSPTSLSRASSFFSLYSLPSSLSSPVSSVSLATLIDLGISPEYHASWLMMSAIEETTILKCGTALMWRYDALSKDDKPDEELILKIRTLSKSLLKLEEDVNIAMKMGSTLESCENLPLNMPEIAKKLQKEGIVPVSCYLNAVRLKVQSVCAESVYSLKSLQKNAATKTTAFACGSYDENGRRTLQDDRASSGGRVGGGGGARSGEKRHQSCASISGHLGETENGQSALKKMRFTAQTTPLPSP